ncbi:YbjQ family protein [Myxococcota bacterium]|nr:YbjQ family protein [Myxococcota bacterium]
MLEVILIITLVLLLPFVPMFIIWAIGAWGERRHIRRILEREAQFRGFPVSNLKRLPEGAQEAFLASGSVVLSADAWKTMLAGFRKIFGGRFKSIEPVIERARREAILRLLEDARSRGADCVHNVRLETANISNTQSLAVEVIAYGTAVRTRR